MKILVNGQARELKEDTTVTDLLLELGLGDKVVAIERNENIVPRADHPHTKLTEGDQLEVVHFVGGG